jgi:hypothetical protein
MAAPCVAEGGTAGHRASAIAPARTSAAGTSRLLHLAALEWIYFLLGEVSKVFTRDFVLETGKTV